MEYKILKEKRPSQTTKKLSKILKNKLNAYLQEDLFINQDIDIIQPVSLRLSLYGINSIGTNGKGTCIENARASAYGEFFERLQNQTFISGINENFMFAPDEIFCDTINNNLNKYFENITNFKDLNILANKIVNKTLLHKNTFVLNNNELFLLPFYNVKDKKIHNIPYKILRLLQITNGMSAGNTPEEALVQGISEICERYVLKEVFTNKISMPDIPEEYYMKYETIKQLIDYYKNLGYILHIKDASLNKNIPAVCIITEDKENNIYFVNFGAHPSLPVAIERTLTEFSQGCVIKNKRDIVNKNFDYISTDETDTNTLIEIVSMTKCIFKYDSCNKPGFFFNTPSQYKFSPLTWIDPREKTNNKQLLKILLTQIKEITENNIYIRDVSFLGVPAYYIFIPNMSLMYMYDEDKIKAELNLCNWIDFNTDSEEYSIESLLNALEYKRKRRIYLWKGKISTISEEYLCLLCSIVLQDKNRILKYANDFIKKQDLSSSKSIFFNIIKDYYSSIFKSNTTECINYLSKKYKSEDINNFFEFNNNLSFDVIKNIILSHKHIADKEQETSIMKNEENIKIFRKKLAEEYKKHLPNQIKLKKII